MTLKGLTAALLCAALLCGCGGDGQEQDPAPMPAPPETEAPPDTPAAGGALRLAMRMPKTLNPLLNEDATVDIILRLMFEPLLELDASQRPVNRLAANVNPASDGMSAIITLKPGLKWGDGEPITAEDVRYSLETLQSASEHAIYRNSVRNILDYTVTDELNIKISYAQPFGGSQYLLCFPVIPEHFYKDAQDTAEAALGSGLYEFSEFKDNELLILTAARNALGERPYISEVQALVTSDRETDLNAFEQGMIDLVRADISSYGKLSSELTAVESQTTYFDLIGFNFEKPSLQDLRVRTAVAHAVDKPKLLHDIYLDYGSAVNAPIDGGSWLFKPDTADRGFDLEKSAKLLEDAGVRMLGILVNEENDERVKIANALKESLEQAGISVAVESEGFSEYQRRLEEGEFDMAVMGFYLSVIPELTFAFGTDAENNYFSYSSPVMDGLLSDAYSAAGERAYIKAVGELQSFFADELPCVSLVFRKSVVLTSAKVRGELSPTVDNPLAGVARWYIREQ